MPSANKKKRRGELQNRSKLEISADILRVLASKGPTPKTHVMYGANLSYDMLGVYLEFLLKAGFIERREAPLSMRKDLRSGGRYDFLYELTPKGRNSLEHLDSLLDEMGLVGFGVYGASKRGKKEQGTEEQKEEEQCRETRKEEALREVTE